MRNKLNLIKSIINGFLSFLGICFFGALFYYEIQNIYGILIAIAFIIVGFFLGRFVYIVSMRRGSLALSTALNATPDLDNINPGEDSTTRKLLPQEFTAVFSKRENRFRGGTLRIWGDFKSRCLEQEHFISKLKYSEPKTLQIYFHSGCKLTIWEPDVVFEASSFMKIVSASRVKWEWIDSQKSKNFYFDYRHEGRSIKTSTDFNWKSYKIDTMIGEPAILMVN